MKEQAINILRSLPWIEGVSNDSILYLSKHSRVQTFPAGTVLFEKGGVPDFLYVSITGTIEIFACEEGGEELVIEIASAPNAQTIAAVISGAPYIVSGRVAKSANILMIDAVAFRKCVLSDEQLSLNLLGQLAWQFRTMVRQVATLKTKSTAERLGCYLLSLVKQEGCNVLELPHDRRHVARHLGMTTMSLSRAFRTLTTCGVQLNGNIVEISDPKNLQEYCRPDPLINEPEPHLKFLID